MLSLHTMPDLPSLACPCLLAAPTQTLPVLSFFYWRNKFCGEKRLQGKHNSMHMGWPFTDANLHHTDFVSKTRTGIHKQVPNCNPCPRPSALRGYGIKCLPVLQVSEIFFVRLKAAVANNTSGFVDIAEGPLFPFATNTLVCLL